VTCLVPAGSPPGWPPTARAPSTSREQVSDVAHGAGEGAGRASPGGVLRARAVLSVPGPPPSHSPRVPAARAPGKRAREFDAGGNGSAPPPAGAGNLSPVARDAAAGGQKRDVATRASKRTRKALEVEYVESNADDLVGALDEVLGYLAGQDEGALSAADVDRLRAAVLSVSAAGLVHKTDGAHLLAVLKRLQATWAAEKEALLPAEVRGAAQPAPLLHASLGSVLSPSPETPPDLSPHVAARAGG